MDLWPKPRGELAVAPFVSSGITRRKVRTVGSVVVARSLVLVDAGAGGAKRVTMERSWSGATTPEHEVPS